MYVCSVLKGRVIKTYPLEPYSPKLYSARLQDIWRDSRRGNLAGFFRTHKIRGSKKGLATRGGWRKEILPAPEIQTSFCALFPMPPLGKGNTIVGPNFRCSGLRCSPTSSRQPLFETSNKIKAQKFRGKFRSILREKIRASKELLRANFVLQTCHPKVFSPFPSNAALVTPHTGPRSSPHGKCCPRASSLVALRAVPLQSAIPDMEEPSLDIRVVKTVPLANGHFAGATPAVFVIFVDFRGPRSKIPCCGQNGISEFCQFSSKPPVFGREQNDRFPKRPFPKRPFR